MGKRLYCLREQALTDIWSRKEKPGVNECNFCVQPGQVVKLTRGAGFIRRWWRRDCGFESRVRAVRKRRFWRRFFLLISYVHTWFRELVFRIAQGSDDFITVHKFETEGRLVKRKGCEISCRPRELANNVEPQRSLSVESPIGASGR